MSSWWSSRDLVVVMLVEGWLLQIPGGQILGEVRTFEVCVGLQSKVGPGEKVGPPRLC